MAHLVGLQTAKCSTYRAHPIFGQLRQVSGSTKHISSQLHISQRSRGKALLAPVAASDQSPQQPDDLEPTTNESGSPSISQDAPAAQQRLPPAILRKVSSAPDANEALDVLVQELGDDFDIDNLACQEIMAAAIERGNIDLASAVFKAMTSAAASSSNIGTSSPALASTSIASVGWPPASTDTAAALVLDLCRALCTKEAVGVIQSVRSRGLPVSQDVQFGYVVECPSDVSKPLAVVQPQEGVKAVADAYSRYEYELFSGTVESCSTEPLISGSNILTTTAVRFGLLKTPAVGAVHALVVETPSGQQRSFRFGTATADVPAKVGDRVTLICSPQTPTISQRRILSASPPGTKPGEALLVSNHTTKSATPLLRPPNPASEGLPRWALPVVLTLAASDAASSLIDPALPLLIAGGIAVTAASAVAGSSVLVPKLKQLPERIVEIQATRQKLLGQHTGLEKRINELVDESVEDVRTLARLWQLQNKMGAVSAGETAYSARLERVAAAKSAIELRVSKRLELLDSYARVINMIEIEVEMETEVPVAELQGIEQQIVRLGEIEELAEEWQLQAEAQDEVERLLRAS